MVIDVNAGTVAAACAASGLVGKVVHSLVAAALDKHSDKIKELEGAFRAARETQKTLFDKLDAHHKEFQDYKLSVAERYVAAGALKEMLAPLVARLEGIEHDLRNGERPERRSA